MKEIKAQAAPQATGQEVRLKGHIHAVRRMGNLAFVVLRDSTGTIQLTVEKPELLALLSSIGPESAIAAEGLLQSQPRAPQGVELTPTTLEVLSASEAVLPVEIAKDNRMETISLSTMLDYRPLTLRAPRQRAIFKIEAELCAAFRRFLTSEGFTEIHSPKIVSTGTEGGAQLFAVDYFGNQSFLAQSPQFYKQIMVGVFERVFEIAAVYRAEEHDTSRHLNEYISMDLEMGFIESEQDVMSMQVKLLAYMFESLRQNCPEELQMLEVNVPVIKHIPQITLQEACRLLTEKLGWKSASNSSDLPDLDPEAERMLCQHFRDTEGSELLYITQYPVSVRPFYAAPLEGTSLTHSFDLLFRGLEITTGGQRIHRHAQLVAAMQSRGLPAEKFADYLQCFRYGMPPHGGLAIGLERLAKQLLGLSNVKLASLFPRDRNRVSP